MSVINRLKVRVGIFRNNLLLLVMVVVLLLFGLWPFKFSAVNQVCWLDDQDGIQFQTKNDIEGEIEWGKASVFSSEELVSFSDFNDVVTFELFLEPFVHHHKGTGYILSLFDNDFKDLLVVGQWRDDLELFVTSQAGEDHGKTEHVSVDDCLPPEDKVVLALAFGLEETHVYLNGESVRSFSKLKLDRRDLCGRILLGCSTVGQHRWPGRLYGLAIYRRVLNFEELNISSDCWYKQDYDLLKQQKDLIALYPFSERCGEVANNDAGRGFSLNVPHQYHQLKRIFLKQYQWSEVPWLDFVLNIVGFVPLGGLLALRETRLGRLSPLFKLYFKGLVCGFIVSAVIEGTQYYMPTRYSAASDLFLNILGTMIGVRLFCFLDKHFYAPLFGNRDGN